MIILDKQLNNPNLKRALDWWHGGVLSIEDLHPKAGTINHDPDLIRVVRQRRNAVLVSKNHSDFWEKCDGDPAICVLCLDIGSRDEPGFVSGLIRQVLQGDPYRHHASRNGTVLRASTVQVLQYRKRSDTKPRRGFSLPDWKPLPLPPEDLDS